LAKQFQRRRFLEIDQSKTRIACGGHSRKFSTLKQLGQMDRNVVGSIYGRSSMGTMSNLYRGSSIDASYQVSVHLAEGFQRRRLKCEKLTDDR
jgi:hypothetical protein